MIMNHLPVLAVVVPLSAALLSLLLSRINKNLGKAVVILSLVFAFLDAVGLTAQVLQAEGHLIRYAMGNWDAPIGIEFYVDPINALLACFITFIAMCASIYSLSFLKDREWLQSGGYYTLIALLTVGLVGMTLTGDVFNLYVYLEISSLSCYGLIALGGKRSIPAAFRYLLIGTIGASFYLLGIGLMYAMTGSLNMADMGELLQSQMDNPLMYLVCASLIGAFGIKMAQFPFHAWQPDAYAYSHPGASPLISGAMSKVPALAMIRFFFFIFGVQNLVIVDATRLIGILGALGMIFGSVMALNQTDFRRMLAYSSVAQLGYIALGIGIGNLYGVTGSYLHILNHLFMKGGLFFAIGAIQYRFGIVNINQFGQLHKKMPFTCFTITMGALAMVGIPPTGGFFSKWYLMMGAMDKHLYIYMAVLVLSSLLNAIYFLRVLEKIFIAPEARLADRFDKEAKRDGAAAKKHFLEVPAVMLVPIVVFGIGIVAMGIFNSQIVEFVAQTALKGVF